MESSFQRFRNIAEGVHIDLWRVHSGNKDRCQVWRGQAVWLKLLQIFAKEELV